MFYKVVYRADSDKYLSYNAFLSNSLVYKVGIKTVPKIVNSKLFVFDTYDNALHSLKWMSSDYRSEYCIFKCECENPDYNGRLSDDFCGEGCCSTLEEIWEDYKNGIFDKGIFLYKGTVFVDSVTLIEEVK